MISRVHATNNTPGSLTYPATVVDDLLFLVLQNTANSNVPGTPSGYTSLTSGQDSTNGFAMRIVYKFATSTSEAVPSFTDVTSVSMAIYRGVDPTTPFSGTGGQSGSTSTISYSGIASYNQAGSSWVITAATVKGITGNAGSVPPNNTTLVTEYKSGSDDNAIMDSNGVLAAYSFNSKTLAATLPWLTKTTELRAKTTGSVFLKHQLTAGSNTDATSYNTASVTPTANRLQLLWVYSIAGAAPNQPTVTGNGLTWVNIGSVLDSDGLRRITLFRAMGGSPSAGAIAIDFGGQTQTGAAWSLAEYDNVDTGGTNGSAAVVQVVTGSTGSNGTSLTVTLAAFASAANATVGGFGIPLNTASNPLPGTGFGRNGQVNQASPNLAIMSESVGFSDTSVDSTSSGTIPWVGIAAEVGTPGGGPATPTNLFFF